MLFTINKIKMKNFLLFLIFLILTLLQVSFRLPNLVLGLLILIMVFSSFGQRIFILAFLFGFCLDLISGGWWGLSSAFFLLTAFFYLLYQRRFFAKNLTFIALLTFFASLAYDFIIQGRWRLGGSLALVLLVLAVDLLLSYFLIGQRGLKIDLRSKK